MPAFARPFRAAEVRLWLLCRKFCDLRLISGLGLRLGRISAASRPPRGHKYGSAVNAPVMKRLPESGLVPLAAGSVSRRTGTGSRRETRQDERLPPCSGVAHVFGVCSLRIRPEEAPGRGPGGVAGQCGLDRPVEPDDRGGPRGRAAGRDRGADPGGHAGNRDFQPALYRERRPLHDRDADVPIRHRYAEDDGRHLHPRRPPPGDGALRRAEAVCAGRAQAGALMHAGDHRAKWC